MALEQTFVPKRDPLADPEAFENEIPTYRAISALALFSAAFGLLSGLSFVSFWWLVLSVLAVVFGVLGARRVASMPDVLTGRSYAHAGIAMGLIFGISAVGYEFYSYYSLKAQSRAFATIVLKSLNDAKKKTPPDTAEVMWWMMPPDLRKGKVPEDAREEIAQLTKSSVKVKTIEEQIRMMAGFAGKDEPVTIVEVEDAFYAERDGYATILLKVGDGHNHGRQPGDHSPLKPGESTHEIIGEYPENALLVLHGVAVGQGYGWYVDDLQYPYKPKSVKVVPKKPEVDDGHGHAH